MTDRATPMCSMFRQMFCFVDGLQGDAICPAISSQFVVTWPDHVASDLETTVKELLEHVLHLVPGSFWHVHLQQGTLVAFHSRSEGFPEILNILVCQSERQLEVIDITGHWKTKALVMSSYHIVNLYISDSVKEDFTWYIMRIIFWYIMER